MPSRAHVAQREHQQRSAPAAAVHSSDSSARRVAARPGSAASKVCSALMGQRRQAGHSTQAVDARPGRGARSHVGGNRAGPSQWPGPVPEGRRRGQGSSRLPKARPVHKGANGLPAQRQAVHSRQPELGKTPSACPGPKTRRWRRCVAVLRPSSLFAVWQASCALAQFLLRLGHGKKLPSLLASAAGVDSWAADIKANAKQEL